MNVNAGIIDQRLNKLIEDLQDRLVTELRVKDQKRQKSLVFVYLCVLTLLDLESDDAFYALTDGGNDFGVDAIHIGEELDQGHSMLNS